MATPDADYRSKLSSANKAHKKTQTRVDDADDDSVYIFKKVGPCTVRAIKVKRRGTHTVNPHNKERGAINRHTRFMSPLSGLLLLILILFLLLVGLQLQQFVRKKSMRVPTAKAGNRFYKLKITISELYQEEQENGKDLNSDQLQAVSRYDEVQQTLEFARDLSKQFNGIAVDAAKQHKKQARKEALEKAQQEVAKVKKILMVQDQVQQIAKYLLVIVEGLSKEIVGTTYAKLKELVATIHASAYFDQAQEEVIEAVQEVADEGDLVNALEPTGEEVYVDKTPAVQPTETFPQVVCEEEPSSEVIIKKEKPEAFTTSEEKKHTKRKHSLENSYEL